MPHTDTDVAATACLRHRNHFGDPWCSRCRTNIYDAIGDLPTQHARLLDTDGQDTRAKLIGGRTSIDPPSPSPRFDDADEIATTLASWAGAWADHLGETYAGRNPRAAATYLLRHRTRADLLSSPLAGDLGQELLALHGKALLALGGDEHGRDEIHDPLRGLCPRCHCRGMHRVVGTEEVHCGHRDCGHEMTWDEYGAELERQNWQADRVRAMRQVAVGGHAA